MFLCLFWIILSLFFYYCILVDFLNRKRELLDLGCGPGTLVCTVAKESGERAWGIDLSPAMCEKARIMCEEMNLSSSVTIFEGDVRKLEQVIPKEVIGFSSSLSICIYDLTPVHSER